MDNPVKVIVWQLTASSPRWRRDVEFMAPASKVAEMLIKHGFYLEEDEIPVANSGESFTFRDMGMPLFVEVIS